MKWIFVLTLLVVSLAVMFPSVTLAVDPGGLVTCSGPEDCNFCTFIQMVSVIISWLFGFLVLVAVLLIVFAGFKLVVSAGNPSAMTAAKGMISNVIIGFVIVMAAWLIVDTLMKTLANPGAKIDIGMWNELDGC